ncbi:MAG: hypothetical protein IH946_08010 [Bacteroidetes bacterium]|nr:hypothetical protein [Bacteroidota bacterium]
MKRSFPLIALLFVSVILFSCKKETCTDGEKNQDESGVDCGGVCTACPSCFDGIKNQDETAIDCGGICSACSICDPETFSATIDGNIYNATFITTNEIYGTITISGSNITTHSINLQLNESMTEGIYDIFGSFGSSSTVGAQYTDIASGGDLYEASTGSLTVTEHDLTIDEISGTFFFQADPIVGGTGTRLVTAGSFCVAY